MTPLKVVHVHVCDVRCNNTAVYEWLRPPELPTTFLPSLQLSEIFDPNELRTYFANYVELGFGFD